MQSTRIFNLPAESEVVATVQTDVGCVREANEDSGRHMKPNDPDLHQRKGTLTIVADGMGGHASGEVASQMAVDIISEMYYGDTENTPGVALKTAIETANHHIHTASASDENLFGMGTTVVALAVQEGTAFVAHVGDSRVYHLRGNDFHQVTIDHSQVMEMVKYGIITREEARNHDDKNVILRALGTQPQVEAELSAPIVVEPGDEFLLCSDGLCDMLEDEEIGAVMLNAADVHEAGEQLIEFAKQRGGHDNITVGIVRISPAGDIETNQDVRETRELRGLQT